MRYTKSMTTDKQVSAPISDELSALLSNQLLCSIATIGADGYPNSASVAFSHTPELSFVFSTDDSTRKAANIARNGKVAITVTDAEKRVTMQAEGVAVKLSREEFTEKYETYHFEKLPFTRFFKDIPTMSFYIVTPVHMKLTDINEKPWKVQEILPQ